MYTVLREASEKGETRVLAITDPCYLKKTLVIFLPLPCRRRGFGEVDCMYGSRVADLDLLSNASPNYCSG